MSLQGVVIAGRVGERLEFKGVGSSLPPSVSPPPPDVEPGSAAPRSRAELDALGRIDMGPLLDPPSRSDPIAIGHPGIDAALGARAEAMHQFNIAAKAIARARGSWRIVVEGELANYRAAWERAQEVRKPPADVPPAILEARLRLKETGPALLEAKAALDAATRGLDVAVGKSRLVKKLRDNEDDAQAKFLGALDAVNVTFGVWATARAERKWLESYPKVAYKVPRGSVTSASLFYGPNSWRIDQIIERLREQVAEGEL